MNQRLKDNIKGKTWAELCEIWFYVESQMQGSGERRFQMSRRMNNTCEDDEQ